MSSVWVIEDGEYSDYRVVGVFSSRERAEKVLAELQSGWQSLWGYGCSAEVNEWPLDPFVEAIDAGLRAFRVALERNGDVESVKVVPLVMLDEDEPCISWSDTAGALFVTWVLARDEKHAIKVANERRARFIAEGGWDA